MTVRFQAPTLGSNNFSISEVERRIVWRGVYGVDVILRRSHVFDNFSTSQPNVRSPPTEITWPMPQGPFLSKCTNITRRSTCPPTPVASAVTKSRAAETATFQLWKATLGKIFRLSLHRFLQNRFQLYRKSLRYNVQTLRDLRSVDSLRG